MSKPDIDSRRRLAVAGMGSHDPLEVVNEFYQNPGDGEYGVFSEWWQIRICILAERIAAAEKHREELREQNRRLILAAEKVVSVMEGDNKWSLTEFGKQMSTSLLALKKAMKWQSR
jgi:hypothetical protein